MAIVKIPQITHAREGMKKNESSHSVGRNGNWCSHCGKQFTFSHSVASDSVTPCAIACQAPLSMKFSRQEYWSGLPFPSRDFLHGIFPTQGSNPHLLHCRKIIYHWATREALENSMGGSFKKLKIELLYDPAIPVLGIYLEKTKTLIKKDTCTTMFIAILFTQPRDESIHQQRNEKNE